MIGKTELKNALTKLVELRIIEHEPIENMYHITELFYTKLGEAIDHLKKNPQSTLSDFDETQTYLILSAYFNTVKRASVDDACLHVTVIQSFVDAISAKELDEFAAKLRLLERV